MPSSAELSKIMKSAGYTVPDDKKAEMSSCVTGVWDGTETGAQAKQCERGVMGKKFVKGSVAQSFSSKWTK